MTGASTPSFKRWLPLIVIAIALALFLMLGGQRYLSMDALAEHRRTLLSFAQAHPMGAPLLLVLVYAALVAISLPGASYLTIFAGFLFGTWWGGLAAWAGANIGANLIFAAAKTSLGESLSRKAGPWLAKFRDGFAANALSYLLVLRLAPVAPFWAVNIAPALLAVRQRDFALATLFGIIPGTFVYASIGAGAGAVLDAGQTLNLRGALLQPAVLGPIVGLIALSLLPILIKKLRKAPA
jgi:uncharacterized membrane protein YdjX (TVP38/TMEM64 family)